MNAQHTPGPWTLDPCADGWLLISNGQDITAAPFDARDADVRLIVAAPDLLAALREIVAAVEVGDVDGFSPSGDWFREAKAALNKVEGI